MSPKVSVVIPAYDAAAFIEETLKTVAAQTYRDFEVVVIDDGSSDGTKGVVERFLAREGLPGRCIRQPNKRIAGARNAGLREARGEFVALLDHDDAWAPDKLAAAMREFELDPGLDLVCHNEEATRDGRVVRVHRYGPECRGTYDSLLFRGNALSPSACVLRRDKALEIGGFREDPGFNTVEDYDFWLRLSRVARFRFLDRVLGSYRLVEHGASRRVEYHHSNLETLLHDHFRELYGGRPGPWARVRIRRRLAAVCRSALSQLMEYGEAPEKQRDYALRMLRAFPFDPKNLIRAAQWAARAMAGRARG